MGSVFSALGSGLKKAGQGVQGGLDWLHQQSHDERLTRMQTETGTARAVVDAYLKDPNGPVTLQGFHDALDTIGKNLPKSHQDSWKQFVGTIKSQTAPALPPPPGDGNKPQTLSPAGAQPIAPGLPAPPSAADTLGAETGGAAQAPPFGSSPAQAPSAAPAPQAQSQPAASAAAPQLPVVPPSPVSEGFSTPGLPPPPVAQHQAPFLGPEELAQRNVRLATTTAQGGVGIADMQARALRARMGPEYDKLSPLQKAQLLTGHPLTMDYRSKPGTGFSKPGDVLADGSPAPGNTFGRWEMYNGMEVFRPMSGALKATPITDSTGTVTQVLHDNAGQVYDQNGPTGKMLSDFKGVNPSMQPHVTARTGEQIITTTDENGNIVQKAVPISSRTVRTVGGAAPAPVSLTPPPSRTGPPASVKGTSGAGGAGGGRVLGQSPQQTTRQWENELTPNGQKAVAEVEPVLDQVNRAMAMLESTKNENTPLAEALPRLGYSLGIATEASKLINNLELGKVIGASRVLKGGSRALPALELAMQHLPIPEKDSAKLMYEKLQNVKQNLEDIKSAAFEFERKYPGMPRGKGGITPPPSSGTIKVRRISDGQTGTLDPKDFDPQKYSEVE